MTEIIFHQYAMSPFSEKIRKILAAKDVAYRQVDQPAWMPKPQLTPLTGGYRRIPVLQIGADIYCDSALIARRLDAVVPDPSIYADGNAAAAEATALWADKVLFPATVPLVFTALADIIPPELFDDRRAMFPQLNLESLRAALPAARGVLHSACEMLEQTLARHAWVLGAQFTVADAAVYHTLWFARGDATARNTIYSKPKLGAWMQKLEAMGAGRPQAITGEEAMEVARRSEPADVDKTVAGDDPTGLAFGTNVAVASDDLPQSVFTGRLVALRAHEMVIERREQQVGRIAVHFPRAGYAVRPT